MSLRNCIFFLDVLYSYIMYKFDTCRLSILLYYVNMYLFKILWVRTIHGFHPITIFPGRQHFHFPADRVALVPVRTGSSSLVWLSTPPSAGTLQPIPGAPGQGHVDGPGHTFRADLVPLVGDLVYTT